jgi:diguanylate cyclase (GGDEF)-like protein/PAS domain S-box-containing protein
MYSIDQQARDAVQISLRFLRAEAMNSIPIVQDESNRFIFDHLALQRFDIPLSLLPPDSIIKNRQFSFWELYQPQIIATGMGIVGLLFLVVFLLGMTRQLNHTRLALANLNVHLDTQVQERTARLNQTNIQLQDEIDERKRTEEKLSKSESSFQAVLQSTADGILAVDSDNRVLFVNERFVEMWQIPAEVLASKDDVALLQHVLEQLTNPQEFLDKVQELYESEQESFDSLNFKDGRVFERLSRPLIREQKASGRVWSFRDITARKRMEEELRESERRTATILRSSPIVIGVSTVAEGRYTDVNDEFEKVLGYSLEETIGRTSFDLNLWVDDDTRPNILREIQAHGRVENLEIRLRRKSGEIFPALILITPIVLHDTACLLTMMMDITVRKQAEEQLRDTRDTLQTIIHSSPLAILAVDPEDHLTMWNPAAEAMFGWSEKQILGQANPTVPENKLKEYEALRKATLSGMTFSNLDTLRMKKDGTQFPVSLSVAPLRGQQSQVIGRMHVLADITERKKLQEELRQQATTDELTRISNRRHFMELAQSEIKRALRLKRSPAIALIDIDHFKQVNDTFGHSAGDQALIAFTKICQKQIREIDVFARFGGDEFVLLLPETSQEQAYEVLERVRLVLTAQPLDLGGNPVALTISAGIASLSDDKETFDTLLSQADQALYRAKEAGRNKVVRYDTL